MARSNFEGYYLKIGNVIMNDPSPLRGTYKFAPALVQAGESKVLASGKLSLKILAHDRRKIWCEFPMMTPDQFRRYWNALHSDAAGHGMYLKVTAWDESGNRYVTDTYYHNDLQYTEDWYGGQRMIKLEPFELIGH